MKSARINFGIPQSEYVAEVNDQGEAISFRNQDTGNEYVGGGGTISGLCTLTDGTLDKSYNDLLSMINAGVIPFIFYTGFVYILGSCDIDGDGISFRRNSPQEAALYFAAPDGDPDANLILD